MNQDNNSNNQNCTTNIKPSTSTAKRIETNCDQNPEFSSPNDDNSSSNNSLNSSSSSLNHDNDNKITDNYQPTLSKWRCTACTYDNWPKSNKCILCSTPKALNTTTSAINLTNNNSLTNVESAICSGGKSITNSIVTDDKLIGATSQRNRLNNNNVNTIINYNLNNNRRKNREYVDWNWLEACVGVLNGN